MDEAHNKRLTRKSKVLAEWLLADVFDPESANDAVSVAVVALADVIFTVTKPDQHDFILSHVQKHLRSQMDFMSRLAVHGPASDAPAGHA